MTGARGIDMAHPMQYKKGGKVKKGGWAKVHKGEVVVPKNKVAKVLGSKKRVGKLNAAKRNKLKKSTFGVPGSRKYPMPDRSHAANAKARATQMVKKGKLSASSAAKIKAKANRILGG